MRACRIPFASWCAIAIYSLALSACLSGHSDDGSSGPGTPAGAAQVVGKYVFRDGKLTFPPFERSRYECGMGSEPVLVTDTTLPDTAYIDLRGDSLYLGLFHPVSMAFGNSVQMLDLFGREGSGSGLEGRWTYLETTYRVLSGELSDVELDTYGRLAAYANQESEFQDLTLVFADGILTTYSDRKTAANFLAAWNGHYTESPTEADSAVYAVTVRVLDPHTLELKGRITGETVRVTIENDGVRTYSSTLPGHGFYRHDEPAQTCPNESAPNWYYEFIAGNKKP